MSGRADGERLRRSGRAGLAVAALAVSAMGLGGPLMLATTGDPSPLLPFYPAGWLLAAAGWGWWLRCRRAARRIGTEPGSGTGAQAAAAAGSFTRAGGP